MNYSFQESENTDIEVKMKYYNQLEWLEKNNEILLFRVQPKYLLQKAVTKNLITHKKMEYVADFEVHHLDGSIEVIEIINNDTTVSKIKRRLFKKKYPHVLSLLTYNTSLKSFVPCKKG